ncbi:hypothetical protein POF50_031690 [Streptomyces sp. SL13]|uniref:Sel1 repeat family protein n=1 Tax=Streptantibioticus silvisoli TaxID=2705255 RepID=A0AA90HF74_9ACTN|nr:hypothetical protein [Streptantibioticus silvisoli]MDI5973852.1 hypothetical protein [Streptantibioticus silvisoli]
MARLAEEARAGDPVAMANYGTALHLEGHREPARAWLLRAWDAGNAGAGFNLGTLYLMAGDTNQAHLIWQQAARLGDADAMLGLVRLALGRDDPATALDWSGRILAQDETFPITALGVAFRDHGDETRAVHAFERATEMGDPYAMDYLAELLERRGGTRRATELRASAARARAAEEASGEEAGSEGTGGEEAGGDGPADRRADPDGSGQG